MPEELPRSVRQKVVSRARYRCEYCLIHEDNAGFPLQIDHIVSRKHGGPSSLSNLAYCYILCNRYKGSDIASVDRAGKLVPLFHPRRNRWIAHFRVDGPLIEPISAIGEATAKILRLNTPERVLERRLLQSLGLYPR